MGTAAVGTAASIRGRLGVPGLRKPRLQVQLRELLWLAIPGRMHGRLFDDVLSLPDVPARAGALALASAAALRTTTGLVHVHCRPLSKRRHASRCDQLRDHRFATMVPAARRGHLR